jgi:hypothetical protein
MFMRRSVFYMLLASALSVTVICCASFRTVFTTRYIFPSRLIPFVTARKGVLEVAYNHRTLPPTPAELGFAFATYDASIAEGSSIAGFSFHRLSEG